MRARAPSGPRPPEEAGALALILRIGRYALHDRIASGGQASVYLGRAAGAGGFRRTVAIKRLHPHLQDDRKLVARFLDEARLAANIHHPNVVPILDVVVEGKEVLLVMDLVMGPSLAALLASARTAPEGPGLPPAIAIAVAVGALRGLHAAHEAVSEAGAPLGIVHRDVSPENVLVGADGTARVVDFGIAKALGRAQPTADGELAGKLGYMSPEQLRGEPLDRRADVYAAGVVTWETLTGRRLFEGDPAAVMMKVLEGAAPPPSAIAKGISPALDAAVARALRGDPGQRWETALAFAEALRRAQEPASPEALGARVEALEGDAIAALAKRVAEVEGRVETGPQERSAARRLGAVVVVVACGAAVAVISARGRRREAESAPATAPAREADASAFVSPVRSSAPRASGCGHAGESCCASAPACSNPSLSCRDGRCRGCAERLFSGPQANATCAVTTSKELVCWGLPILTPAGTKPTAVGLSAPSAMVLGTNNTLAVRDGAVFGWGYNHVGELGDARDGDHVPVPIQPSLTEVTDVSLVSRSEHSGACAVAKGRAYCWGSNYLGALGPAPIPGAKKIGAPRDVFPDAPMARVVAVVRGAIDAGCAIDEGRQLYCWGNEEPWHVLDGPSRTIAPPAGTMGYVPLDRAVNGVAMTLGSVCYAGDRAVVCWGANDTCQIGHPAGEGIARPGRPRALPEGLSLGKASGSIAPIGSVIAAGGHHFCVIDGAGAVWCWGSNNRGQSGMPLSTPTACAAQHVPLPRPVKQIVLGTLHSCALDEAGLVHCWGANDFGQLGRDDTGEGDEAPAVVPIVCDGSAR